MLNRITVLLFTGLIAVALLFAGHAAAENAIDEPVPDAEASEDAAMAAPSEAAPAAPDAPATKPESRADWNKQLNAILLVNRVVNDVRDKAGKRHQLLTAYLRQTRQMDAYKASDFAQTPDEKNVPLTYEDAVGIGLERIEENPSIATYEHQNQDVSKLKTLAASYTWLGKSSWDEARDAAIDVPRMEAFVKDADKWDAFLDFVDKAMGEEDASRAAREQELANAKLTREEELQRKKEQLEAERAEQLAEIRSKHEADMQREWDRRVQVYQLETDRVRARNEYKSYRYGRYYYPDGNYYKSRYYRRYNNYRW